MKENHVLALIVAYYLSKYDKTAYKNIGFTSQTEAHNKIGRVLGANPNSVKNMRDEFDPLHDNPRVGWYQRTLRPSRVKVVEAFQEMSEVEFRDVVLEILTNPKFQLSDDCFDIIEPIAKRERKSKGKPLFILRGPTGRKAEEFFIRYHQKNQLPHAGRLEDTREQGCGYDFAIHGETGEYHIEVKGLDKDSGGIVLTSKEWDVARRNGPSYYLAIVRNLSSAISIQIIQNPTDKLQAKKNVFTAVQIRWTIGDAELGKLY